MQYNFNELINLINKNKKNTLENELKKIENTTEPKKTPTQKQKQTDKKTYLLTALAFIQHKNKDDKKVIDIETLANWADSPDCTLPDKTNLATQAWKQFFTSKLKLQYIASDIISLGSTFFYEPQKFTAFLLWLISKEVTAKKIIDSKLLHKFFLMHMTCMEATEDNILNEVYCNLEVAAKNNEEAKTLLKTAQNTPAGLEIISNFKASVEGEEIYESHSLLAPLNNAVNEDSEPTPKRKRIRHTQPIETQQLDTLTETPPVNFNNENEQNIQNLFDLFGTELIDHLDFNTHLHQKAFKQLIKKNNEVIISTCQKIQGDQFDLDTIKLITAFINEVADINKLIPNISPVMILYLTGFEIDEISCDTLNKRIENLIKARATSHTENELILLTNFTTAYINNETFFTNPICDELQAYIYDHALKYFPDIDDELEHEIINLPDIEKLFEKTIQELSKKLTNSFDDQNPVSSLTRTWSESLSISNFIKRNSTIYWTHYPFTTHQVWSEALKKMWLHQNEKKTYSSLSTLIHHPEFYDGDPSKLKRNLLEALLHINAPHLLIEITQYLEARDINWRNEIFGNNLSLSIKAVAFHKYSLFEIILNNTNQLNFDSLLHHAVQNDNTHAVEKIIETNNLIHINEQTIYSNLKDAIDQKNHTITRLILRAMNKRSQVINNHITHTAQTALSESNWQLIENIALFITNPSTVRSCFKNAIQEHHWAIARTLATQLQDSEEIILLSMEEVLTNRNWETFIHLINFSENQTIFQRYFNTAISILTQEQNWAEINSFIEKHPTLFNSDIASFICDNASAAKQWETIKRLFSLPEEKGPYNESRRLAMLTARKDRVELFNTNLSNGPNLFSRLEKSNTDKSNQNNATFKTTQPD